MYPPKSEIFVEIGNVKIYYYGLIMSLAIFCAFLVMKFISKRYYNNVNQNILMDLLPIVVIFGIFGGRLYYVLLDINYYIKNVKEILAIWHGGLSIHGALLSGFIVGYIYLKVRKEKVLPYADVFAFGLLTGQIIGRWGNFFNSEAFGSPCNLPWKLFVPITNRPLDYINYEFFHPTFLYESIWNLVILLFFVFVLRKICENRQSGLIFFSYLFCYSLGRIFIEMIRVDSICNIGDIPIAILVSVVFCLSGIFGILFLLKEKRGFKQ